MFQGMVLCILLPATVVLGAGTSGTGAPAGEPNEPVVLPGQNTAEYWVIRTQALTELVPYMTQKREEFKAIHQLLTQFLDSIGKGEDFVRSGAKAPDTPEVYAQALGIADQIKAAGVKLPEKPATWDELVEAAMRYKLHEGYIPTRVADAEELAMIRKGCEPKERYGQKVRKEMRDTVKKCLDIWTYLGTVDRQADAKAYVYREREKARQAKEEEQRKREEERKALGRDLRAQRASEKERLKNEQMWEGNRQRMDRAYYGYRW